MSIILYKAIVFFPKDQNKRPHKYRNVQENQNFVRFMLKLGADYANLYDEKTKSYIKRIYAKV
jgi:hypothetical protein